MHFYEACLIENIFVVECLWQNSYILLLWLQEGEKVHSALWDLLFVGRCKVCSNNIVTHRHCLWRTRVRRGQKAHQGLPFILSLTQAQYSANFEIVRILLKVSDKINYWSFLRLSQHWPLGFFHVSFPHANFRFLFCFVLSCFVFTLPGWILPSLLMPLQSFAPSTPGRENKSSSGPPQQLYSPAIPLCLLGCESVFMLIFLSTQSILSAGSGLFIFGFTCL